MVEEEGTAPSSYAYQACALLLSYSSLVDPVGIEPTDCPLKRRMLYQLSYGSLKPLCPAGMFSSRVSCKRTRVSDGTAHGGRHNLGAFYSITHNVLDYSTVTLLAVNNSFFAVIFSVVIEYGSTPLILR